MDITARNIPLTGAPGLTGRKDWVRELADPSSVFYQDMLAQLQKKAEEQEERDREDAIIEAFGQVIDAMNAKEDDPKGPGMGKSFLELTQSISRLEPDDPERVRLEQLVKRMGELGIWFNLPGLDREENGETETLTQLLTKLRVKELKEENGTGER